MNEINLKGIIKNIEYSHNINDIEFYKANLLVKREDGKEDIVNIKFKRFSNPYKENEEISLTGNLRTFSRKEEGKSKVDLFVFTYFDKPEELISNNIVKLRGNICKKNEIRKTRDGKDVINVILANNIKLDNYTLNCYIPLCLWGKQAKTINELPIGTPIYIEGRLISREYKKYIDNDYEIRIAHEVNVNTLVVE